MSEAIETSTAERKFVWDSINPGTPKRVSVAADGKSYQIAEGQPVARSASGTSLGRIVLGVFLGNIVTGIVFGILYAMLK